MNRKELCFACGMTIENVDYRMHHHKLAYHFCSDQCSETFQSDPGHYRGNTAKEIGKIYKRRRLRLTETLDENSSLAVRQKLKDMMGVNDVY